MASSRISRRDLLKRAAFGGGAVLAAPYVARAATERSLRGMNVLLFVTDQERAIQHFPSGWAAQNLPGLTRLQQNGLTFTHAFTNSCMCSPARSTLMSGFYPARHGVKYTLEEDMPAGQYPQVELPADLPNPATVAAAAGYTPVYKGKWYCSKASSPADLEAYGFGGWDPPDAGADQDVSEAGGGSPDNDGRYVTDVLDYLGSQAARDQPFFLVVSLVNPHDVLLYPKTYADAGYDDSWLDGSVDLPETVAEDLSTKPTAQRLFLLLSQGLGVLTNDTMRRAYLNFYANLMRASDAYLVTILDALQANGLLDSTLVVRTADHGELGLAHGGLRQKNFNAYEEAIRVPLVYSNPRLFRRPQTDDALVSHVDFLPTLAGLLGAPRSARAAWQGRDYSGHILGGARGSVHPYVVFTYDDIQAGQASGPYIPPPNHVVATRDHRWKVARYYDANGAVADEWELYDLRQDPLETTNLAAPGYPLSAGKRQVLTRLQNRLATIDLS
jgi:arylsulfatase A-like enzyme